MLVANLVLPLSLAASAAAAAANPFMPANLAVRFKSEKQQPRADTVLTRAQKKAALAIAKRENKKLSGTEDLVALLACTSHLLPFSCLSLTLTACSGTRCPLRRTSFSFSFSLGQTDCQRQAL